MIFLVYLTHAFLLLIYGVTMLEIHRCLLSTRFTTDREACVEIKLRDMNDSVKNVSARFLYL